MSIYFYKVFLFLVFLSPLGSELHQGEDFPYCVHCGSPSTLTVVVPGLKVDNNNSNSINICCIHKFMLKSILRFEMISKLLGLW